LAAVKEDSQRGDTRSKGAGEFVRSRCLLDSRRCYYHLVIIVVSIISVIKDILD
jgi:hypothetical protein